MRDYEKEFKDKIANLVKIKEENGNNQGAKLSYNDLIVPKFVTIIQKYEMRANRHEHHIGLIVSLLPEWAISFNQIEKPAPGMKTAVTLEEAQEQFDSYYHHHTDKTKPVDMWKAPLAIRYEYFDNVYNLNTGTMKAGHKFLTYQEAVEIFTKDEKFQESVKDHAVVVGKYCLQYVYLQKQEDKTKAHPYWVYPKHYKAIIDKATYDKLKKHQAFVCKTKLPNSDTKIEKTAINLFAKPATRYDTDHFKELDLVKTTELDKDQKIAVNNFKYREYVHRKQKRQAKEK